VAEMSAQIEEWKHKRNAGVLNEWLDHSVGDWFVNHVITMDFVTAGYIEMKQKTG